MDQQDVQPSGLATLELALRGMIPRLHGAVRYRMLNTLDHFERAFLLYDIDRAMASFRAITGEEEEAATALMSAINLRKYPHAKMLNIRDHRHKVAVLAGVIAIGKTLASILQTFKLDISETAKRLMFEYRCRTLASRRLRD